MFNLLIIKYFSEYNNDRELGYLRIVKITMFGAELLIYDVGKL